MDSRPIGVFDSGLGGLTAVKELRRLLPEEDIVYFGDTARVPYGTRSDETIRKFAAQDARFLMTADVKLLAIACGTVSSIAIDALRASVPCPVVDAALPAAGAAVRRTRNGRIAILGTNATIRSRAIERHILRENPDCQVLGKPCPLLVPLIENGYVAADNPILRLAVDECLEPARRFQADTIVLGCTHYPIIKNTIQAMAENCTVIDSGAEIAAAVARALADNSILNDPAHTGTARFYVSDTPDSFARQGAMFLGSAIDGCIEKINIEQY